MKEELKDEEMEDPEAAPVAATLDSAKALAAKPTTVESEAPAHVVASENAPTPVGAGENAPTPATDTKDSEMVAHDPESEKASGSGGGVVTEKDSAASGGGDSSRDAPRSSTSSTELAPAREGVHACAGGSFDSYLKKLKPDELGISVPDHFRNREFMLMFVDGFLTATCEHTFAKKKNGWSRMMKCVNEMDSNLRASTKALSKHIDLMRAAGEKAAKKKKDKQEKDAIEQQKADLQRRAVAVKAVPAEVSRPMVFNLAETLFDPWPTHKGDNLSSCNLDKPVALTNSKLLQSWVVDRNVQMSLASFGGKYKKQDSFKSTGKCNAVMTNKMGRAETEKLMGDVLATVPVLDISEVSSTWNGTSWLFGVGTDFHVVAPTPNSAALLRVLWMGEMEVMAWPVVQLKDVLSSMGKTVKSMDDLVKVVGALTEADVKSMKAKELIGVRTVMSKEVLYFVPAGWLIAERCRAGPLLYGVRKSVFVQSENDLAQYSACHQLLSEGGVDTTKMAAIKEIFSRAMTT